MSALGRRIGYDLAADLMAAKRAEEEAEAAGLRDGDQPSEADGIIQRILMRSEFTPDERHRIRLAVGIDPVADVAAQESERAAR